MFLLIAEAKKLRKIAEAISAVHGLVTIRASTTQFFVRAVNRTQNFTALIHLDHSWFRYYNSDQSSTVYFDIEELNEDLNSLDDDVTYACIYRKEENEARESIFLEILKNCSHIFCRGYSTVESAGNEPWPELDVIELHTFKVGIHPKDLIRILEYSISCFEHPMVLIHVTDSKLTLSAGTDLHELEVGETVIQNLTCILRCDDSGGIRGLAPEVVIFLKELVGNMSPPPSKEELNRSSCCNLPTKGIDSTLKLKAPVHWPLLAALKFSQSILVHFTPLLPYEPLVFECSAESVRLYFILPPLP